MSKKKGNRLTATVPTRGDSRGCSVARYAASSSDVGLGEGYAGFSSNMVTACVADLREVSVRLEDFKGKKRRQLLSPRDVAAEAGARSRAWKRIHTREDKGFSDSSGDLEVQDVAPFERSSGTKTDVFVSKIVLHKSLNRCGPRRTRCPPSREFAH